MIAWFEVLTYPVLRPVPSQWLYAIRFPWWTISVTKYVLAFLSVSGETINPFYSSCKLYVPLVISFSRLAKPCQISLVLHFSYFEGFQWSLLKSAYSIGKVNWHEPSSTTSSLANKLKHSINTTVEGTPVDAIPVGTVQQPFSTDVSLGDHVTGRSRILVIYWRDRLMQWQRNGGFGRGRIKTQVYWWAVTWKNCPKENGTYSIY